MAYCDEVPSLEAVKAGREFSFDGVEELRK